MVRRLLPLFLLVLLFLPPPAQAESALSQADNQATRSQRLERAVAHFNRAFYELTPRKRDAEAAREFDLAIVEFEAELRDAPSSVEAHRFLARIYTHRKQPLKAARHYDDICALLPFEVDALVLAANAYAEAGRFDEARERLITAKGRTTDAGALARLDEYLSKLDSHERENDAKGWR